MNRSKIGIRKREKKRKIRKKDKEQLCALIPNDLTHLTRASGRTESEREEKNALLRVKGRRYSTKCDSIHTISG